MAMLKGAAARTNKTGQALGQKGAETRRRLLLSAMDILQRDEELTAAAVSRASNVSAAAFYVYFDSLPDLQLSLADEVRNDMTGLFDVLDREWCDETITLRSHELVGAFYEHWRRYRAVLITRNHQADLGKVPFIEARRRAAMPVIERLADRMREALGPDRLSERDAFARSVIIFAAMERLAARANASPFHTGDLSDDELMRAEAHILSLLFRDAYADETDRVSPVVAARLQERRSRV